MKYQCPSCGYLEIHIFGTANLGQIQRDDFSLSPLVAYSLDTVDVLVCVRCGLESEDGNIEGWCMKDAAARKEKPA